MKFVLAPDSFKESMTAKEAATAMEMGIRKVFPDAEILHIPMSDGGEGTTEALVDATGGTLYKVDVLNPLGKNVSAAYGILGDGKTAIMEMANASGLELLEENEKNPLITTTYGTGQLMKACLEHEIDNIIIGLGGSATNDGGAGMVQALGGRLLNHMGKEIGFGGEAIGEIATIDLTNLDKRLSKINIEVACDVTNPFTGKEGASYIFGKQKGASNEEIEMLDQNLIHFAKLIKKELNIDIDSIPGAGAAGGLGGGLLAFLSAKLERGIDIVLKYTDFEDKIKDADFIFTGEGSIDEQTLYGKTLSGIANVAQKHSIPVIAFAGNIGGRLEKLYENGFTSIIPILTGIGSLEEALASGKVNLEKSSESVARILAIRIGRLRL